MTQEYNFNREYVRGFYLDKIELLTHQNKVLVLSSTYSYVEFSESLFSPTVVGFIHIIDKFNFPTYGPIVGGEQIYFHLANYEAGEATSKDALTKSSSQNTSKDAKSSQKEETVEMDLRFVVYAVETKNQTKNELNSYVIRFCSKELFWNQQLRICTTYFNNKYTIMVHKIFNSLLKEREKLHQTEDSKEIAETWTDDITKTLNGCNCDYLLNIDKNLPSAKGGSKEADNQEREARKDLLAKEGEGEPDITCHFPNMHPFECIQMVANRAQKGTKGNPYFFFECLNQGYYFQSWKKIKENFNYTKGKKLSLTITEQEIKEGEPNKNIFVTNVHHPGDATFDYYHKFEDFFSARSFTQPRDFDFFENLSNGIYASTLYTFDYTTKKLVKHKFNWDKMYKQIPRIYDSKEKALIYFPNSGELKSEYFPYKYQETYVKTAPTHSEAFLTGKMDFFPEISKNYRQLKLQELNNNYFTVNIPGNISYSVGKFTDIYIISPDTTAQYKSVLDPHFAGTYFNLRVKHMFYIDGSFITSIEMCKDSFMDNTLKDFPSPDDKKSEQNTPIWV